MFSGEIIIELEWQLRIIMTILEQMDHNGGQFTGRFLDSVRKSISIHKNAHLMATQHGGIWKTKCLGSNEADEIIKSFKCNYNNDYLLKLIKNTLNTVGSDINQYQTSIDRAIAALKGLLIAVPGLAKAGIKLTTGIEVPLGDFDMERSWK